MLIDRDIIKDLEKSTLLNIIHRSKIKSFSKLLTLCEHNNMDDLNRFLEENNISPEQFKTTTLAWDDLLKIRSHYQQLKLDYEPTAKYLIEKLHNIDKVHSVRYRLKDPDHLISKIIRKRIENPKRIINIDNYQTEITDLIGIRILHLFKEDWESIHHLISDTWNLHENPIAYVRNGDTEEYLNFYKNNKCEIKNHPYGYRSVHYLVKCAPTKTEHIAEIQVRTIFEEAWSEIDHTVCYPNNQNNILLSHLSVILNRLSGSADEMGSYIKRLKKELELKDNEKRDALEKSNNIITELKNKIKELELPAKQKKLFENDLNTLSEYNKNNLFEIGYASMISASIRDFLTNNTIFPPTPPIIHPGDIYSITPPDSNPKKENSKDNSDNEKKEKS